jgi:hypothetical protein
MKREIAEKSGVTLSTRTEKIVRKCIKDLNLDLSGFTVLTEAASGNYIATPLVAATAGAVKTIAIAKDSRYGKADDVAKSLLFSASSFGVERDSIEIVKSLSPETIGKVDIVTNLGFVRPINKHFISRLKQTVVIPLMYETWEFREEDLDLRECWRNEVAVLGTNEQHRALRIFDYIGHLCMKILFESEIEVLNSRIALIGENKFGRNIVKTLSSAGSDVVWATNRTTKEVERLGGRRMGVELGKRSVQRYIIDCDAIIINTYPSRNVVIGESGSISARRLAELAPRATIIQLNGMIERKSLQKYGLICLPVIEPEIGHMGWTLTNLGPKPLIALNSGGLKVGELLAKARLKGLDRIDAEHEALKDAICQDFSPEQRKNYG